MQPVTKMPPPPPTHHHRTSCNMGMGTPLGKLATNMPNLGIGHIGSGTLWDTRLFEWPYRRVFFFLFPFLRPSPDRVCGWLQPPLVRK